MAEPQRPPPPLSEDARALMAAGLAPVAYVERLLAKELHEDALVFTAHVLPARDLIWWGCLCAWKDVRPEPLPKEAEAFRASLRWIQKPGEETRRAAGVAAEVAGVDTPAGAVAQAVFASGGTLSAPGLPEAPPPPEMMPSCIVGGLRLAAAQEDALQMERCFRRFVLLATEALKRLSTRPSAARPAAAVEGSIASRWQEEAPAAPIPSAEKTPPPAAASDKVPPRPAPNAPLTKKPTRPDRRSEEEKDAWEGLSKLEDD